VKVASKREGILKWIPQIRLFSLIGFFTTFFHRAWPSRKIGSRRSLRYITPVPP
jgi:hypothetical protein